jgi:tubulin monoglycylase TTLL3/8
MTANFGSPKTWVVQKYIENPLLIMNRKFDIRVWVLVANWNPLQIYLYHDCYIRFSATDYNPKNVTNMFIHLTNNSISKNCSQTTAISDYFSENMWSLDNFKTFLAHKFHKDDLWQSTLLP